MGISEESFKGIQKLLIGREHDKGKRLHRCWSRASIINENNEILLLLRNIYS